jgi:hypothetical protein
MIMRALAINRHADLFVRAMAKQGATGKVRSPTFRPLVNRRMYGN